MAGSVNKVILIGNLGADPEVRTFAGGSGKVANLRIATSESWRDKNTGERKEKTEWHKVSVLNEPLVDLCEKYLKKGSTVYIEGQLETRKWQDQSGKDQYSTEIVLRAFRGAITMLDKAPGGNQDGDSRGGEGRYDRKPGDRSDYDKGGSRGGARDRDDMNDEIPF